MAEDVHRAGFVVQYPVRLARRDRGRHLRVAWLLQPAAVRAARAAQPIARAHGGAVHAHQSVAVTCVESVERAIRRRDVNVLQDLLCCFVCI